MRKFSLFMLMAVGLLISGNLRAVNQENGHAEENVGFDVAKMDVDKGGVVTTTFYATLQEAFDDVPDNSYPATITVLKNTVSSFEKNVALKLGKHQNVTLDLNGFEVISNSVHDKGTAVIENSGTLTIADNSTGKTGLLSNVAANPDIDWEEGTEHPFPGWANNVITNYGTVIINGGYLKNVTSGAACYVVDNQNRGSDVKLIINGGTLEQPNAPAIRIYSLSSKYSNDVILNDGLVWGYCTWIQLSDKNSATNASLTINGGEIRSHANAYVNNSTLQGFNPAIAPDYIYNWPGDESDASEYDCSNMKVSIHGGVINQNLYTSSNANWEVTGGTFSGWVWFSNEEQNITGGYFYIYKKVAEYTGTYIYENEPKNHLLDPGYTKLEGCDEFTTKEQFINAGYIVSTGWSNSHNCNYWEIYILKDGSADTESFRDFYDHEIYTEKTIKDNEEYTLVQIVPISQAELPVDAGEINLSKQEVTIDETTNLTITPSTEKGQESIINIDKDTKVNQIEITNVKDESGNNTKGEAQIVVKNGATLNVGNGGIVSENDYLTTVKVETGGTLIVGVNGVEQDGLATPIMIQTSEKDGTGTLVFNPNSQTEKTKNYAEVDLYTYCKQVGGKYFWQQFAIPVTELANDKVAKNPNITSYVFAWDYSKYGWSQLSDWSQVNEPFAGYDVTNVSENGGVVYTFKGDLIGNQNIQLTLPHKDYCVMGNSYTAPIDITELFNQINKEMSANTIEKTVYKYDAKAGYYVYTNELEQTLNKMGIVKAGFTEIKPMEGFLLNLQNGNTAGVMLNYANAVFNPAMDKAAGANKAPRMNNNTDFIIAKINISSAHATDLVTLVEGDEFSADIENGKDAFKYLNEGANLYAFDGTNKLAMVATNNLEGTILAFQAAEDAEYTLTFDRVLNADYSLLDLLTGESVEMVEGNTYTFYATPNTLNPSRFMVIATAKAPTAVENAKVNEGARGIYTIMGQYIGSAEMWNEMPQGVYMVNGVKVIK